MNQKTKRDKNISHLVKNRILDELWDWIEIGITCEKPNPAISQMIEKIGKMRESNYLYESDVIAE